MTGPVQPIISKPRLVELYRPLVGPEDKLADLLLLAVSERIRRKFAAQDVAALDESDSEVELVIYESVSAVLRHLDFAGLKSVSFLTDDATESRVFADALAALTITDAQWIRLGLDLGPAPSGYFPVGDY